MAMLWTLLIFLGCLTPSAELPHVAVPFVDKWTHFVLFGGFSFLWLCAYPGLGSRRYLLVIAASVLLGIAIELLQGALVSLGRSMELMDAVADALGGLIGAALFRALAALALKSNKNQH